METNGEWFESEDERTMRLLEADLESLANVLEDLTASLADLLALLRQPNVQLQFTLELRAPRIGERSMRWN